MGEGRMQDRPTGGGKLLHDFEGRSVTRRELRRGLEARFQPLRPARSWRLLLAGIFGPLVWVACILFAILLIKPTDEVLLGALITVASLIFATTVLLMLRRGRIHEERDYVGPT
jgi:drug/metabolite transporter (DMT)-like permease